MSSRFAVTARRLAALSLALLAHAIAPPSAAEAAVGFSFAAGAPSYSVAPGATVQVPVYLVETVSGGDASLLAAEAGLEFAQVRVSLNNAPAPLGTARIAGFTPNPAFADSVSFVERAPAVAPYTMVSAAQGVAVNATAGILGEEAGPGVRRVLLLTLDVRGGDAPGETARFELADDPRFAETITFGTAGSTAGTVLDARLQPGSFTVTSVPEPTAVAVWVLAAAPVLMGRRRRRIASQVASDR